MRISLLAVLALALAGCGRPAEKRQETPPPSPPPVAACNNVTINPGLRAQVLAGAAAAQSLLGGPITPGIYDLVSMEPRGGASAPAEDLWESVEVRDTNEGIVLDFAIVRGAAANAPHRVTARLAEGSSPQLVHTCGATGAVPVTYAARPDALQLELPAEGGVGQIVYAFTRRVG